VMCFKCPYCKEEECRFNPACDVVEELVCSECRA
jgi:hypothetical protein